MKFLLEMAGILWRWWLNSLRAKAVRGEEISAKEAEGKTLLTADPPKTIAETTHENTGSKVKQSRSPLDWH